MTNVARGFKSLHNRELGIVNMVDDVAADLFQLLHYVVHTTFQYVIGDAVRQINNTQIKT